MASYEKAVITWDCRESLAADFFTKPVVTCEVRHENIDQGSADASVDLLNSSPMVEVLSTEDMSMPLQLDIMEPKVNEEDRHLIDACRDLWVLVYGEFSPQ